MIWSSAWSLKVDFGIHVDDLEFREAYEPRFRYRPTDLPTYRPADLPTDRRTDLPTYLPTDLLTYLPIYLSTYLPIYLPIYLSTYLPIYVSTYSIASRIPPGRVEDKLQGERETRTTTTTARGNHISKLGKAVLMDGRNRLDGCQHNP